MLLQQQSLFNTFNEKDEKVYKYAYDKEKVSKISKL